MQHFSQNDQRPINLLHNTRVTQNADLWSIMLASYAADKINHSLANFSKNSEYRSIVGCWHQTSSTWYPGHNVYVYVCTSEGSFVWNEILHMVACVHMLYGHYGVHTNVHDCMFVTYICIMVLWEPHYTSSIVDRILFYLDIIHNRIGWIAHLSPHICIWKHSTFH